jgi:hypothetical protein
MLNLKIEKVATVVEENFVLFFTFAFAMRKLGNRLEEGNQSKMVESLILNQFDKDIWSGGFLFADFQRSF